MSATKQENCPCTNVTCANHGNCFDCIIRHRGEGSSEIVACQREKAQGRYSKQD